MRYKARMTRAVAFALAAGAFMALAGCYSHVVGAKGFGSDRVTLHEPNLEMEPSNAQKKVKPLDRRAPSY